VALIVDANVFIHWERQGVPVDLSPWQPSGDVFILHEAMHEQSTPRT